MAQKVLILDDEEVVGSLISDVLSRQGLTPLFARTIDQAMKFWDISRADISLLIADLHLGGGVSGMDFAERLLKDKPGLKIIFTSGFPVADVDGMYLSEGLNFLKKPFRLPTLIETVQNALA